MPVEDAANNLLESATCRGCGYLLRGLDQNRCPECGRAFDPAKRRTMNLGRTPGRIAQRLMTPVGWRLLTWMFLATAAIVLSTRLPVEPIAEWKWSPCDLEFYADSSRLQRAWPFHSGLLTLADHAYFAGLVAWCVAITYTLVRLFGAIGLRFRYRQHDERFIPAGRAILLAFILGLISIAGIGLGWSYRLGTNISRQYVLVHEKSLAVLVAHNGSIEQLRAETNGRVVVGFDMIRWRSGDPTSYRDFALRSAVRHAPRAEDRLAALVMATAQLPKVDIRLMAADVLQREQSSDVLRAAVYVLAVMREPSDAVRITPMLDHQDAMVRTAAIDALAFMHDVQDVTNRDEWLWIAHSDQRSVVGSMLIDVRRFMTQRDRFGPEATTFERKPLSAYAAESFIKRVNSTDASCEEREAAARACLAMTQSNHQLRWAEFTVWRHLAPGRPQVVAAGRVRPEHVVVERPTTMPADPSTADLPHVDLQGVVFLSSQKPVAAQATLAIGMGYTDIVWPPPSDRVASTRSFGISRPAASVAGSVMPAIRNYLWFNEYLAPGGLRFPHESFHPWLGRSPGRERWSTCVQHTLAAWGSTPPPQYTAIGHRWNNLVVTPDVPTWLKVAAITGQKSIWWEQLRTGTPGGVWSRGEAEKFIYYEGRTYSAIPLAISANGQQIRLESSDNPRLSGEEVDVDVAETIGLDSIDQSGRKGRRSDRRGMVVTVKHGFVSAEPIDVPAAGSDRIGGLMHQSIAPPIEGDQIRQTMKGWLIDAGLAGQEADAALSAWNDLLFKTEGRRVLVLLAAVDTDSRIPLNIRPRPAEIIRVGIGWWEL